MASKILLVMAGALILLLIVAAIYATPSAAQKAPNGFTFNGKTYNFTFVALTPAQQEQGLMNYTVTNTTFELFSFQYDGDYAFWMKNTYYPLDMIWVSNNTVIYIANATPCVSYSKNQSNCIVYDPHQFANYVIEAKSGFVNRTDLKVGDKVSIN